MKQRDVRRGRRLSGSAAGSRGLDPKDAQAIRAFVLRVAILGLYAVGPRLLGSHGGVDVVIRFMAAFGMGSLFAMAVALLRGERAGIGCLNGWDEAMAFNGLWLLMHLAQPMFGVVAPSG